VFSESTKALIKHDHDLEVLRQVFTPNHCPSGLPSWIPDWKDHRRERYWPKPPDEYAALGLAPHCSFDADCRIMTVEAKIVDTILTKNNSMPSLTYKSQPGQNDEEPHIDLNDLEVRCTFKQ
jgi:hypothetical protein